MPGRDLAPTLDQEERRMPRWFWTRLAMAVVLAGNVAAVVGAAGTTSQTYKQTNLVSDVPGLAPMTDPALVNPWGMSFSPTGGPFWVSNTGTNTSTFYSVDPTNGAVAKKGQIVVSGSPTGQVYNTFLTPPTFVVSQGGKSGPALFIFAGTAAPGTITAWSPVANAGQALVAATGATGSSYTGLAMAVRGGNPLLYAANKGLGRIDVFDSGFNPVTVPGGFADPNLPADDKPYNVSNINGDLYVTYTGSTAAVDVFDVDGTMLRRLATGGTLHNPWGIALAPGNFGAFSNAVLVGNFNFGNPALGTGVISAFDPTSGQFMGLLDDAEGNPIWIDGLWTLMFGNGGTGGAKNVLYFSAGIQGQKHGLFGSISAS
jgi:uncharacterized protein (TIGR03118 family)